MGRLLRAEEAAQRCDVAVSTIYAWAAASFIPHIRFGEKAVRFPEDELERWLAELIRRPGPKPAA